MKKHYAFSFIAAFFSIFIFFACSESEDDPMYTPIPTPVDPVSPVNVDLSQVPYDKLSKYQFFEGTLKDQKPAPGVLPFQPSSALFTDYAHKKRFVWLPKGTKATYNSDNTVLDLPIGAALIKTFYYDNVQNVTPVGSTRIIETRVMIRKADGWIFANYVWNAEQSEATYDMAGSFTQVVWKDENNIVKSANYKIPADVQCMVCHKSQQVVNGSLQTVYIPIGIKPQNLNFNLNYGTVSKNQLEKWIEYGYLASGFSLPSEQNTTVDYSDASKPVSVRARSYVDANCAHCHQDNRHCDYRPMRFAFSQTADRANMGVCVDTEDMQDFPPELGKIVTPGNVDYSMLYYRINTTNEGYRMPLHGRTIIHTEGVALIREWIDSLHDCE